METPEGKIKGRIKRVLNKYQVYSHMPVQNGMGSPTLDYVCCWRGLYIGIEAKAPGKKPTPRQEKTMSKIRAAGGFAFVVSNDETLNLMEKFFITMGKIMDRQLANKISKLENT